MTQTAWSAAFKIKKYGRTNVFSSVAAKALLLANQTKLLISLAKQLTNRPNCLLRMNLSVHLIVTQNASRSVQFTTQAAVLIIRTAGRFAGANRV